jgi:hypothetical protein
VVGQRFKEARWLAKGHGPSSRSASIGPGQTLAYRASKVNIEIIEEMGFIRGLET